MVTWEAFRDPNDLLPGMQLSIERPKSGAPPDSTIYVVKQRDGDGWLMTCGSRVPDSAPCWSDGRVSVRMEQL
jgi:hypothetical protein